MPLEATRSKRRYCALSKISSALSASRSNGWKQSACKASMAEVSGALMPANRSKKSFGCCCFGGTGLTSSVEYSEEELEEERARFAGRAGGGVVLLGSAGTGDVALADGASVEAELWKIAGTGGLDECCACCACCDVGLG